MLIVSLLLKAGSWASIVDANGNRSSQAIQNTELRFVECCAGSMLRFAFSREMDVETHTVPLEKVKVIVLYFLFS